MQHVTHVGAAWAGVGAEEERYGGKETQKETNRKYVAVARKCSLAGRQDIYRYFADFQATKGLRSRGNARALPRKHAPESCRPPPGGRLQNRKGRETLMCKEYDYATLTPRRVKYLSARVRFCWPVTSAPLSGFKVAVEPPLSAFVSASASSLQTAKCHENLLPSSLDVPSLRKFTGATINHKTP